MVYKQINVRGIWRGDKKALNRFAKAFALDCGGCSDTFRQVYGWSQESTDKAIERAFSNMSPGMEGIEI